MVRSFAFAFVCHAGQWEPKAAVLAASLREHAPPGADLFAVIPGPTESWGEPKPATLAALAALDVRIVRMHNPFGRERPLLVKILPLRVRADAQRLVALDADILATAPFRDSAIFDADVVAKPVDLQTWTRDPEEWRRTHEVCGDRLPDERLTATVSGEQTPPLFNSGVLVVREPARLAAEWRRCAAAMIAAEDRLPFRESFWSNQPALAVALHVSGMSLAHAGEQLNYPVHLRPLARSGPLPVFCHYHRVGDVRANATLRGAVTDLADRHPRVAKVLADHPAWRALSRDPRPRPRARRGKDIVITGISRSGTSHLCHLLHRHSSCVALIDPPRVYAALAEEPVPWGVPAYVQAARAAIVSGRSVVSKVRDGLPVEDTFPRDERVEYTPVPATPDFVLAVKNVRALLARIEAVRPLLEHARIVMCARDPYDAIASWKRTFDHLREADVENSGVSHPGNRLLPQRDREQLAAVAKCADVAERRARFWAWSAGRVLEHRGGALLVDYEVLVSDPHATLDAILRGFDPGERDPGIAPSAPRRHRHLLDARDYEAIGDICVPLARELGLAVRRERGRPGRLPPVRTLVRRTMAGVRKVAGQGPIKAYSEAAPRPNAPCRPASGPGDRDARRA